MKKLFAVILCLITVVAACFTAHAEGDEYPMLNVPQIRVVTAAGNGTELQKDDGYVNATITITDTNGSVLTDSCQFKVRGNTTAMTHVLKKAFTFKFAKKKNVLGLGSGKKWALLANTFDPTLLRNYLANTTAHELGLNYTSNQRFVELWVDGSYRGCYGIYEPVQEGKDRVNIDIESNDGMKDFLIEYEASREEEGVTYFNVSGLRFIASEPEEPNEAQLNYITSTMQNIVDTLKTGSREDIEEVLDVSSFAKFYILHEYMKTLDFDMSSVYYYYQDGKLYAGPAWDFDLAAGDTNAELNSTRSRIAADPEGIFGTNKNIYRFICDKEWFLDEDRNEYLENYEYFCNVYFDGGLLDSAYAEYADIFARNYTPGPWNVSKWWINYGKQPLKTYEENFDYLKNWLRTRNVFLTRYFDIYRDAYFKGDADCDTDISIVDVTAIQRHLANYTVPYFCENAGNVDGDSELTILDATILQRYLAGYTGYESVGTLTAAT